MERRDDEDKISTARGIVYGTAAAIVFWVAVFTVIWIGRQLT